MAEKKIRNRMSEPWGYRDQDTLKKPCKPSCFPTSLEKEIERAMDKEFEIEDKLDKEIKRSTTIDKEHDAALNNITELITDVAKVVGALDEKVEKAQKEVFYSASYDPSGKTINFYNKTLDLIDSIDATPFLDKGVIDSIYIDHETNELVFTWHTAAGEDEVRISLTEIFNSDDYYTKEDIDAKLTEKADKIHQHLLEDITDIKEFYTTGLIVKENIDNLNLSAGEF